MNEAKSTDHAILPGDEGPIRVPERGKETRAVLERAQEGDRGCLPILRELLDDSERGPAVVDRFGSPASWLRSHLVSTAAGKNLAASESMNRKLAQVQAELEGPDPSPIERLLAERAALCWFQVHRYEAMYVSAGERSLRLADFEQKLIDRSHKRFLSALKTLAAVRKLGPAIQVNVMNQVNVSPE